MAAPHVAGAVAVLRGAFAFPSDTIDQTVERLTSTGQPVVDPGNGLTHPRIDLAAALSVPLPGDLPKVASFQPTRASQGQTVTIHGSGFTDVTAVMFGGTQAQSFIVDSPLKIAGVVGAGSTGSVTVANVEGSGSLSGFEFRSGSLEAIESSPAILDFDAFGQYAQLSVIATFSDASQEDVTNSSFYESSNSAVATVNVFGKVTALGNGNALITASNSGFQATTSVSVFFETITTREIEPNNTVQQANPVSLQGAAFSSQLSSTSDVDMFVLTSEQAGELTIKIMPENDIYDGCSVRASILDTDGNTSAARVIRSDSSEFSTLRVLLPTPGTVFLRVDQRPGYTVFDKDYEVETLFSNDPLVFMTRELEPNSNFNTATEFVANGSSFSGQLYGTADVDVYRFNVVQKGALTLLINPENDRYDGGSIRTTIFNAAGETLVAKIIRSDQSQVTKLSALIDEPGPVYFQVDQRPGYTIFDKDYIVDSHFNDDPLVFATRETEANNNYAKANHFPTNGGVISGQLYDKSDVDIFGFDLDSGVVTFRIEPENQQYDGGSIRVSFKDSQDNVLSSRIVRSDEASNIEIEAGIGQRGLYYLVIDQRPGYTIFDKDYRITTPSISFSNQAPGMTSQPQLSASIGVAYSYEISATDADDDELFFFILAGPVGMTISDDSHTLTWTPGEQQWGEIYVDILVSDNFGGIDTQNFVITVQRPDVLFNDGFETQ